MPLLDNLIAILTQRDPFPPLVPEKVWDKSLIAKIDTLSAAPLIKAGLHLLNDDIHNCHIIAQEHENPDGNTGTQSCTAGSRITGIQNIGINV